MPSAIRIDERGNYTVFNIMWLINFAVLVSLSEKCKPVEKSNRNNQRDENHHVFNCFHHFSKHPYSTQLFYSIAVCFTLFHYVKNAQLLRYDVAQYPTWLAKIFECCFLCFACLLHWVCSTPKRAPDFCLRGD